MTFYGEVTDLVERGEPAAMLTVIDTDGSAPRGVGTRMVVTPDDTYGTIGGGSVEGLAIEAARDTLAGEAEPGVRSYDLEPGGNTGMVCGGAMDVFVDRLHSPPRLSVAGGGHISRELVPLGVQTGYAVTVVDDREEFADPGRFPDEATVIHGDYREELAALPMDGDASVVVATRSGTFDAEAVGAALDGGAGYVGLVASDEKAAHVVDSLADGGYRRADLADVRTPVGMDLGGEGPADIALAILAEVHRDRHDATGESLTGLDLDDLVVVRGGGDLGSGVVSRLRRGGFPVVVAEVPEPTVVRRAVAFATAMYEGDVTVEGVTGVRADDVGEAVDVLEAGDVPVLADPDATVAADLGAAVLVDAIMAKGKTDTGTRRDDADVVVGMGPGFEAGADVDAVVETDRGHELGRVFYEGTASTYDGEPGERRGYTHERVLRAPAEGQWETAVDVGDVVDAGDVVGDVDGARVVSEVDGLVRGLVHEGLEVDEGAKLGDVDPRGESVDHTEISDKALSLGGGVLEAVLRLR
jgi:xanthine dehydrogenase accessory factor